METTPTEMDLSWRRTPDAFAALAQRYYRPVCAFVLKRVGEPGLVEDLTQETFLEAYRALRAGTVPTHMASWLFGIAHNRCGKWLRRRQPRLFPATEPPDMTAVLPDSAAEESEEHERRLANLQAGLQGLSEETRELIRMKHQQGQTCEQIARAMGRPVGTVKSQLARAYQTLRLNMSRLSGGAER